MAATYWCMTIKNAPAQNKIPALLPEGAGYILRLHTEKGETRVYFAAEKALKVTKTKAAELEKVSLKDIVTIK